MGTERSLVRPDGRLVAWNQLGPEDGIPVLRLNATPTSRLVEPPDKEAWTSRGLMQIATERPGFGISTPKPGLSFVDHAEDLVAILDELGVDKVPVMASGNAAAYALTLMSRHPDRVSVGVIVSGRAPALAGDYDQSIPVTRSAHQLALTRDRVALSNLFTPFYRSLLDDPLTAIGDVTASSMERVKKDMGEKWWQHLWVHSVEDALTAGVAGWVDEFIALTHDWDTVGVDKITTDITWWHSPGDEVNPIISVRRLIDQMPSARLHQWPDDVGMLHGLTVEPEILDEMLSRLSRTAP